MQTHFSVEIRTLIYHVLRD